MTAIADPPQGTATKRSDAPGKPGGRTRGPKPLPAKAAHHQADLWAVTKRSNREEDEMERLLSVGEAARVLGTTDRFPRRLISERRIRFVRVGRHVRIPAGELEVFIAAGTVNAVSTAEVR